MDDLSVCIRIEDAVLEDIARSRAGDRIGIHYDLGQIIHIAECAYADRDGTGDGDGFDIVRDGGLIRPACIRMPDGKGIIRELGHGESVVVERHFDDLFLIRDKVSFLRICHETRHGVARGIPFKGKGILRGIAKHLDPLSAEIGSEALCLCADRQADSQGVHIREIIKDIRFAAVEHVGLEVDQVQISRAVEGAALDFIHVEGAADSHVGRSRACGIRHERGGMDGGVGITALYFVEDADCAVAVFSGTDEGFVLIRHVDAEQGGTSDKRAVTDGDYVLADGDVLQIFIAVEGARRDLGDAVGNGVGGGGILGGVEDELRESLALQAVEDAVRKCEVGIALAEYDVCQSGATAEGAVAQFVQSVGESQANDLLIVFKGVVCDLGHDVIAAVHRVRDKEVIVRIQTEVIFQPDDLRGHVAVEEILKAVFGIAEIVENDEVARLILKDAAEIAQ